MFNFFKKKKTSVEDLIVKELFPPMAVEILDGHRVCIDKTIDANLEAAYQDILDDSISDTTKNTLIYCLQRLNKVRNILNATKRYPSDFEYYIVGGNPVDISYDIEVKKETPSNEEFRDL